MYNLIWIEYLHILYFFVENSVKRCAESQECRSV